MATIDEVLATVSTPGGSPEVKLDKLIAAFVAAAQDLERVDLDKLSCAYPLCEYPNDVRKAIVEGTCDDSFLDTYGGQRFLIHSEEAVPFHEYCLALEVHSGGAYWKEVSLKNADYLQHSLKTLGLFASLDTAGKEFGSFLQSGSAQRGAAFVWRWRKLPDEGASSKQLRGLPKWLRKVLTTEGADPIQKLNSEKEILARWEQQIQRDTVDHLKATTELIDPFVRAVLKMWPSDTDGSGNTNLKRRAWVEGLEEGKFVGKPVVAQRIHYDEERHCVLELHASIAKSKLSAEGAPPFALTHSWQWAVPTLTNRGEQSTTKPQHESAFQEMVISRDEIAAAIDAFKLDGQTPNESAALGATRAHPPLIPPTATPSSIGVTSVSPLPGRIDSLSAECEDDFPALNASKVPQIQFDSPMPPRVDSMETEHDIQKLVAEVSRLEERDERTDGSLGMQGGPSCSSHMYPGLANPAAPPNFRSAVLEDSGLNLRSEPNLRSAILPLES